MLNVCCADKTDLRCTITNGSFLRIARAAKSGKGGIQTFAALASYQFIWLTSTMMRLLASIVKLTLSPCSIPLRSVGGDTKKLISTIAAMKPAISP